MIENVLAKARTVVVRGLAVGAVIATYAVGSIGTQVATAVGVSTLALTASTTPASAWWRRGWGGGWGWRRGWGYGGWGWRRPFVWGWRRPVWGWGGPWGYRRGWGYGGWGWRGGWRRW